MRNLLRWTAFLLSLQAVCATDYLVYVGTYTNAKSKGIYAWRFDPATGRLNPVGLTAETANPSFLALHPNGRFLYAVNEIANYQRQSAGSVSAFAIDSKTAKLDLLNTVSSRGAGPCHLTLDRAGKSLFVANYDGGSVAAFPVRGDGGLEAASAFIQHSGTVALAQRQGGPHAHCVLVSPDNLFVLAADLGLDELLVYQLNNARAQLRLNTPPYAKVAPGSGPRHLVFHPNQRIVYLINEIKSTITTFSYTAGTLRELQTVSTLEANFQGGNTTAEIVVHPSGNFVYGSNRGEDSIAVFAVDRASGTLSAVDRVSTQGKTPRNFAIDPTGSYLLAANQNSDSIVVFRIDGSTGRLTATGQKVVAPTPVCITFAPGK